MNNYNPKDFTLKEYVRLLTLAKSKFSFKKFTDFTDKEQFVLWRHDIDYSLEHALKIAKIEYENEVSSTFFIHLHNDFYNALDFHSRELIKKISDMGHTIGLHFDIHYYKIDSVVDLENWLLFEKNILETLFDLEIKVFSFHNTNEYTMSFDEDSYAGMLNTYSRTFKNGIAYCSDSNGYWRFERLLSVLQDESITQLQVLLHPVWWTEDEMMPREKIVLCANQRRELVMSSYDHLLEATGRINLT